MPIVTVIRPVILSGGSGTRLWPLSTINQPKQFAPLVGSGSLFEATVRRVDGLAGALDPTVVAGADHLGQIRECFVKMGRSPGLVVIEPEGRNTAPAIAAAALTSQPDDVMVILPADHLIVDVEGFRARLMDAVGLAETGHIVTFGVVPVRPETGYGYIETGDPVGSGLRLTRFKEKPGPEEAESMMGDGLHLWNSGMFVARAGTVIDEMDEHCPTVIGPVRHALTAAAVDRLIRLGADFGRAEGISFDHAVMERTDRGVVLPIDVGWSDIGSFLALYASEVKDEHGNVVSGKVILDGVSGSYVRAGSRIVAVAGISDVVVIETEDAVLVLPIDRSQDVRGLAERARRFEG